MIEKVIIFNGSKKDFNDFLIQELGEESDYIPFMELILHYNARIRAVNESAVIESVLGDVIVYETCVAKADDYASVLSHTLINFSTIVTLFAEIKTLIVHNPPRRVEESLKTSMGNKIRYIFSEYKSIERNLLKDVYSTLNSKIFGQDNCKRSIVTGLYKLIKKDIEKPVVLMFYGPSGVGKTESAKCMSNSLGGELLRIQFSMMQTIEAYNYVFGSEHSQSSFAKDMLARESNVILIDEFDKVETRFYNAFYELFDEGRFVDTNYSVNLKNAIFVLTTNYHSEEEIIKSLGPVMYSRISECIRFEELDESQKKEIVNSWYKEICSKLDQEEKEIIDNSDVLPWFIDHTARYNNIRILKTKLENAIFQKLTQHYIF